MTEPTLRLAGVMVALATPVDAAGGLDEAALGRLVERVVAGGVNGICPAGSTGEGALLTAGQRLAICRRVRALAPPGMPVIPGLPTATLAAARAELDSLAEAGATAVLVAPPFYYPLSADGVLRAYESIAASSPLPLVLYNIPVYTKVAIPPQVAGKLAAHPAIAGMKDSSGDLTYQQQVLDATAGTGFSVVTGADSLLVASLALGATGTIAASANLVPDLLVQVYRAARAGDSATALPLQRRLARIIAACRTGYFPAGFKAALELAGVCAAHPVPPGTPLSAAEREGLVSALAAEGVVTA